MRTDRLVRILTLAVSCLALTAASTQAAPSPSYSSGSFETPNFSKTFTNPFDPTVIGNLRGQDAAVNQWRESTNNADGQGAATGTAVIENKAGGSGGDLQDLKVTRTGYNNRFSPTLNYTQNPTVPIANIDWSMKVTQTTTDLAKFGPFFGIEAYDASGGPSLRIGGLGVDATTGEVLYEDPSLGFNITPLDATVPFDSYQNFRMSLNYTTHTYSILLNNSLLQSGIPFITAGVTGLTDADISALQAAPDADANLTGTAYFDNFTVVAPEPASLGLMSIAAIGLVTRRKVRKG